MFPHTGVCMDVYVYFCISSLTVLYVYLAVCPAACPSIYVSVCMSACLYIRMSVWMSVCRGLRLSTRLYGRLCDGFSVCVCLPVYKYVCLYVGLQLSRNRISQSLQVEGPQNREISLFIRNTIGIFLRELFKAEKQSTTAAITYLQN